MSTFTFRPAVRENTPLIIGIAGPTKSGKTYSCLRVATGIANGGVIAMINAEGLRGHQYAEKFKYVACDVAPPFSPERYTEALKAAQAMKPAVIIIDSASHMHDGPGGLLEYHDTELDRLAKGKEAKRDSFNFMAWVKPKAAENAFIYTMLGTDCPIILAFRAKEKIKIVNGKPIELGWQPIAGERIAFETLFTLMLPPQSKGKPDLSISEMREPFDQMVPDGQPIDEDLGAKLAAWAKGGAHATDRGASPTEAATGAAPGSARQTSGERPSPPKEPSQRGDEPRRGPSSGDLLPASEPKKKDETPLPGVDADDEAQSLVKAIEEEKAKLERQPNDVQWARLCKEIAGTAELDMADPAALQDLLRLTKDLVAKDPEAIEKARRLIKAPAQEGAA